MSSIGVKIDQLHANREAKRLLEAKIKELETKAEELELELIKQMDKESVTKSTGGKATVSIQASVKPSVDDWTAFYAYIHKNKYYHLLERRPAVLACREILDTKGKIPGIVPFTQRKLLLRSI
jgi:hypothetical protein